MIILALSIFKKGMEVRLLGSPWPAEWYFDFDLNGLENFAIVEAMNRLILLTE
jgi:hypothetical protein